MSLPSLDTIKNMFMEAKVGHLELQEETGIFQVKPRLLLPVCNFLKSEPVLALDYLSNLTAVDYPPDTIEVVYHLYSMSKKHGPICLKVTLNREHPEVDSVVSVWRSAEFQEREVYDLYGVVFKGHSDLRRILLWEGFKGHPMRKDYVEE